MNMRISVSTRRRRWFLGSTGWWVLSMLLCCSKADEYERYCIEDARDGFECGTDPMYIRQTTDRNSLFYRDNQELSRGIAQRIDGSKEEQRAIRKVLKLMEEYFDREVVGMPEHELSRLNCFNRSELCAFWAAVGECESNRYFMLNNCAAACRFCLLANTPLGITSS